MPEEIEKPVEEIIETPEYVVERLDNEGGQGVFNVEVVDENDNVDIIPQEVVETPAEEIIETPEEPIETPIESEVVETPIEPTEEIAQPQLVDKESVLNYLKENGIETKAQFDDWTSKNEARLSQLNQDKDKHQTQLDDQKAPKAEGEPPPTKTLPDGGGDDKAIDELDGFVSALENSTKRLIEDDKKAILKMKEFTDTATVKTVEAKDIYQAFLGAQPMTHIRGVKGNHAGVDLQPAADYEKAYGSQVYAPEKMKVTAVNSDLDYGAMVEFQSLVDKRIKYILHHLSPGDVKKNIQVGQEFDSGDALKVRVGGKAEIKQGPHWEGVHLHVEKYIDGKLDSIDNDKNRKTNLKTSFTN